MDFSKITNTDDLVPHFPPPDEENNHWEFKDAKVLSKSEIAAKLGKAVSAFANSGGGYLVFGVHATTGDLQPCTQMFGTVTTKDWLASRVEYSVDVAIQDFTIHKIPIANRPTECIYVVQIGDSQAAPHQSRHDTQYFYRLDGQSMPAPHFHVELLRSRYTRAHLKITHLIWNVVVERFALKTVDSSYKTQARSFEILDSEIRIDFTIYVENQSLVAADSWGVIYSGSKEEINWTNPRTHSLLIYGGCERTKGSQTLLPTEKATVVFAIQNHFVTAMNNDGQDNRKHEDYILNQFCELALKFRAVSHNFVGQEYPWGKSDDSDRNEAAKNHFIHQMRQAGYAIG